ncbi:hypothetical protein DENSPDRAFT_78570 [Dentipellis sp. KUC8613]|nr:hypothetical protein DENSPDRAFT_78570 [Dentipellis sp. KUC8613]
MYPLAPSGVRVLLRALRPPLLAFVDVVRFPYFVIHILSWGSAISGATCLVPSHAIVRARASSRAHFALRRLRRRTCLLLHHICSIFFYRLRLPFVLLFSRPAEPLLF